MGLDNCHGLWWEDWRAMIKFCLNWNEITHLDIHFVVVAKFARLRWRKNSLFAFGGEKLLHVQVYLMHRAAWAGEQERNSLVGRVQSRCAAAATQWLSNFDFWDWRLHFFLFFRSPVISGHIWWATRGNSKRNNSKRWSSEQKPLYMKEWIDGTQHLLQCHMLLQRKIITSFTERRTYLQGLQENAWEIFTWTSACCWFQLKRRNKRVLICTSFLQIRPHKMASKNCLRAPALES